MKVRELFFHWLPTAIAVTGLCILMTLVLQQQHRQSLNDPQVQLAENAVGALLAGKKPAEVAGNESSFDITKSLAPFVAVYDEKGNPLAFSARVHGEPPAPPVGVFEYARQWGENRVTWQPEVGTRIALVIRSVPIEFGQFVAVGRNIREGDARQSALMRTAGTGLAVILIATFLSELLAEAIHRTRRDRAKQS